MQKETKIIQTPETINSSSIKNAKFGFVNGVKTLVTHRDPNTGALWCEDIIDKDEEGNKFCGTWVPSEKLTFK